MSVERPLAAPVDATARHRATSLVLGGDLGGTSTRIVIADHDGNVVGRGAAAGGNPTSHPASAAANFGQALHQALTGLDPAQVHSAVIGTAGASALNNPGIRAQFDAAWQGAGLTVPADFWGDAEVAFASGTPALHGIVMISGTGAIAAVVRDHRIVRTADGHGWLLGDDGSGFWLGRAAMRSVLHALEEGRPLGSLESRTVEAVLAGEEQVATQSDWAVRLRDDLIRIVNNRPPVRLAELARVVAETAEEGDPTARTLVERAAELLTRTVVRVRTTGDDGPLVLAGSVAGENSPVGRLVRANLRDQFDGEVLTARDGVGGATWLALGALDPTLATQDNHTRLVS